jgi:tetratricopeptide (TPR) repeat protein
LHCSGRQAKLYEANIPQSKLLAGEGNRAAKAGEFEEAVLRYSEAISLYPFDHRYFGNRSFCYDYLQDYAKAVTDANSALRIDINWAKGFYRRGRGLAGLKRYEAAVTAFTRALDLNPEYGEAREQLEMVQLEQLQGMGFPLEASRRALAEYHTVPAAIEAMVKNTGLPYPPKQHPVYHRMSYIRRFTSQYFSFQCYTFVKIRTPLYKTHTYNVSYIQDFVVCIYMYSDMRSVHCAI